MPAPAPLALLKRTDIYLIDQILKGRYQPGEKVLDAGCGDGRNMPWFVHAGIDMYGIDTDVDAISAVQEVYAGILSPYHLQVAGVEALPFSDGFFNHVISSAVLHFAHSEAHFFAMMHQMVRVLQPQGSLFIRMTTDIGIEPRLISLGNGQYYLPDGSTRFLLTRSLLQQVLQRFPVALAAPFKSVNVADQRSMCTLLLERLE